MGDNSHIEWTDATWNPTSGCSKVSQGCKHCYAKRDWKRLSAPGQPYAGRAFEDVATHPHRLDQPLRWRRPRRIFVNSMSDLFHEDVPFEFIAAVFGVMAASPQHQFQILTKRPARMRDWFEWHREQAEDLYDRWETWRVCEEFATEIVADLPAIGCQQPWPLPHIWLGVSVEDQPTADERIPLLLDTPAAVRCLSCEPLLGPVDFAGRWIENPDPAVHFYWLDNLDWVIVGGESGPKARPMHPDWARSLRDQCAAAGVPFLFKQWGEFAPAWEWRHQPLYRASATGTMVGPLARGDAALTKKHLLVARVGKKRAGRLLDGQQHNDMPEGR